MSCCVVLCYVMLWYGTMLCYVMICYDMICNIMPSLPYRIFPLNFHSTHTLTLPLKLCSVPLPLPLSTSLTLTHSPSFFSLIPSLSNSLSYHYRNCLGERQSALKYTVKAADQAIRRGAFGIGWTLCNTALPLAVTQIELGT